MNNILDKICAQKKIELNNEKIKCSYQSLEKLINKEKIRNFNNLLSNSQKQKCNNIIAEIKKASPSAGIIVKDYHPDIIAMQYEKSGAGAISILTEKNFFNGQLEHLSLINTKSKIPLLRKDFIFDPYQILQSKIYHADAILLIVSILSDTEITEFIEIASHNGLDCLIEVHTKKELERVIKIGYPLIGINNRNLRTLDINNNITTELISKIPNNFVIVAESGINSYEQIKNYNNIGIYNFLVGESILKSGNYENKIKELKG